MKTQNLMQKTGAKQKVLYSVKACALVVFLFISTLGFAGDSLFVKANNAYANNKFKVAIENYQTMLTEGYTSWGVHYNLGNAYYKRGRYANAILHYEKALKINSTAEEIVHNLQLANRHIIDARQVQQNGILVRKWNQMRSIFSMDGWAWAGIICFSMALLGFVLLIFTRHPAYKKIIFSINVLSLFLFIICTGMAQTYKNLFAEQTAIILQNAANIHSEPNDNGLVLFVLHSGSKVEIIDKQKNWLKVKFDEAKIGWVKQDVLERI